MDINRKMEKIINRNTLKKITAVFMTIAMLPLSDIAGAKMSYESEIYEISAYADENTEKNTDENAGKKADSFTGSTVNPSSGQEDHENETNSTQNESGNTQSNSDMTYEDLNISDDYTLTQNMEVANLKITGGNLSLNGFELNVHGDYTQTGGTINFAEGSLYCDGNFTITGASFVIMSEANDYLYVKGDIYWENNNDINNAAYNNLSNGLIEVCGDFTQAQNYSFHATGYHTIKFSGTKQQNITMNMGGSYFNKVELNNHSNGGVYCVNAIVYREIVTNGCVFDIGEKGGVCGYTLEEDVVKEGDFILTAGELNLNGHTLTVNGDFIQPGGGVNVNGGQLIISGDYRLQTRNDGDSDTYTRSTGYLNMTDEADRVTILGSFVTESIINHSGRLTAGILDIKGNMTVKSSDTSYGYVATGTHKTIFSGTEKQEIWFRLSNSACSRMADMDIVNESEEGVVFTASPYVSGHINDYGNKISGYIAIGTDTTFENNHYVGNINLYNNKNITGDITIDGSVTCCAVMNISGTMNVGGSITNGRNGRIVMNGGKLYVSGDISLNSEEYTHGLNMTHENDYVYAGGKFYCHTFYTDTFSAGTLEVAGDFTTDGTFRAGGSHRTLLSGTQKQTVSMADGDYFAVLEINNTSADGVYSPKALTKATLIRNGCRLSYGDMEGEFGWTLKEDEVYGGDLILIDEELDLNGHTLTVKGDFIQPAGTVKINGGELNIEGDYRIQLRNGTQGAYTYTKSAGLLIMQNDEDTVTVKGNFITAATQSHAAYLSAGTLNIYGDMTVNTNFCANAFAATNTHRLILCGAQKQTLSFGSSNPLASRIACIDITNKSDDGVVFVGTPYVSGNVNDNGNRTSGYIAAGGTTTFENNTYGGNVSFVYNSTTITEELTIGGSVSSASVVNIAGSLNVAGSYVNNINGRIIMQGGELNVAKDLILNQNSYTYGLNMTHEDDYVNVGGNFYSKTYYKDIFSAGTLNVAGNFTTNGQFQATGTHKVILSGDKKQIISMGYDDYFAHLELSNTSKDGIYSEMTFVYADMIANDCNITIGADRISKGITLDRDMNIDGDYVLGAGVMDLNGHTLTINGDLIQPAGEMDIDGGKLIVKGDYRIQSRTGQAGSYSYGKSSGRLKMVKESDEVAVEGNLITETCLSHSGYLTQGTLTIYGDMLVKTNYNINAFTGTDSHKVIFAGDKKQTISFDLSNAAASRMEDIELLNESDDGTVFDRAPYISGNIRDNGNKTSGYIAAGPHTTFDNNTYGGNITILYSKIIEDEITIGGNVNNAANTNIYGKLNVGGSYSNNGGGRTVMQGGKLNIAGNLTLEQFSRSYGLNMTHDNDYVYVGGNFYSKTWYSDTFSAGTLNVGGNFTTNGQFQAVGTHRVILSGNKKQTVLMADADYFATLELKNLSNDGIYSVNALNKQKLILNGCILTYGNGEGTFGWTLDSDYVAEGDFILIDETLDLNGHRLTVSGDFIHSAGTVRLNGGELIISGNYRGQSRSGAEGAYTYSYGQGRIIMDSPDDKIEIAGDFIIQPKSEMCHITDGTITVKGNITEQGNYRFNMGGNATLILSGTESQTVKGNGALRLANLIINHTGNEKVNISSDIVLSGKAENKNGELAGGGSLYITDVDSLYESGWGGNIRITGKTTLTKDIDVGGKITITAPLHTGGYQICAGSFDVASDLYVENGMVMVSDWMHVGREGRLFMQDNDGYVLAGGNFTVDSQYSHSGLLTGGILEVKGDFTQSYTPNFIATQDHTVILSRKKTTSGKTYIQTISFHNPGTANINKLVLKKADTGYQFENDINVISNEIIYDIEDDVPPTPVTDISVISVTEKSAEISYNGAEDESGIAGYEIYRDGKRVGVTGSNSFKDEDLTPDTVYEYSVYAFDEYRNISTDTRKVTVRTAQDTVPPAVPDGLNIKSRTGSSVTITWNTSYDNVGTVGYRIYRDGVLVDITTDKTVYKDTGLEKNRVYTYCIEAVDSTGNTSEKSKELEAVVALPQILSVTPEDNTVIGGKEINLCVKFKDSKNSTGNTVKIEYAKDGEEWISASPTLLGQKKYDSSTLYADYTWNIERLKGSSIYTVRYTLTDADGNIDEKEVTYVIDNQAPDKVTGLEAEDNNGVITLSYDASKNADCGGYRIYRKMADGSADNTESITDTTDNSVNQNNSDNGSNRISGEELSGYSMIGEVHGRYITQYSDRTAEEGVTYQYAVTAYDQYDNESEASDTVAVVAGADLSAPVIKGMTPNAGKVNKNISISISAEDNILVDKLRLEYKKEEFESDTEWTVIGTQNASNGTADFTFDTASLPDGVYIFRATAIDLSGNESKEEYTRRYEVDNTGVGKITITKASSLSTSISIQWEDVNEEDFGYFRLEMAEVLTNAQDTEKSYSHFTLVGTTKDTLGMNVSDLTPDTWYAFRVVGYDKLGNRGTASDIYEASTISDNIAPQITSIYPVSSYYKDKLKLKMNVKDNAGIKSGTFYYSTDGIEFTEIITVSAAVGAKESAFEYTFDITGFEEGSIYIKFEAEDNAGNKNAPTQDGQEIILEYIIDRTAPVRPQGLNAVNGAGYIELMWDSAEETDIQYYKIYRADIEDSVYRLLEPGCHTKNYYDTGVRPGSSYLYKIEAVDIAGNVSEQSQAVVATSSKDSEAPVIRSISPYDGSTLGNSPTIKVLAIDNAMISTVTVEYRKAEDDENIWTVIAEEEINAKDGLAQISWDVEGLDDGDYIVRTYAKDAAGNTSKEAQAGYTLDTTPPAVPFVKTVSGNYHIKLVISEEKASDFAFYEIRRREAGTDHSEYKIAAKTIGNSYTDTEVNVNTVYDYVVRAYDFTGNYTDSPKITGYALDNDTIAPVAILPENLTGMEGMEIAFDATASTDNVRITDYIWSMGNGDVVTGAQPVYTYDKAGEYNVVLTVRDAKGNTDKASMTVRVLEKDGKGISYVSVTDETGTPLPFTDIYIQLSEDTNMNLKTDSAGRVTICTDIGAYKLAAYKTGYLPSDIYVYVSRYEKNEYVLSLKKGDIVTGELTVRKLELQEIMDAGIDLSDPENYNTFGFTVTMTLAQTPKPVEVQLITGKKSYNLTPKDSYVYTGDSGIALPDLPSGCTVEIKEVKTADTVGEVPEVPVLAYIATSQSVTWLKEMYSVDLGILNAAESPHYVIENSKAVLNLPDGLSLAGTEKEQSKTIHMGDIKGQERKTASWIIRGEESGSYQLSADFTGNLMPFQKAVSAHFETENEFTVSTGEGLHIYVMPERSAYIGEQYYVQFMLVNESVRPFYNISTTIGTYSEPVGKSDIIIDSSEIKPYLDEAEKMQKEGSEAEGSEAEGSGGEGSEAESSGADSGEDSKTEETGSLSYIDISTNEEKERGIQHLTATGPVTYCITNADRFSLIPVLKGGDVVKISTLMPGEAFYGTFMANFSAEGDPDEVYYQLVKTSVNIWEGQNLGVEVDVNPIDGHITAKKIKTGIDIESFYGDPVDLTSGSFTDSVSLMALHGGSELAFHLSYDSRMTDVIGDNGYGWYHNFSARVEDRGGYIRLYTSPEVYTDFMNEDIYNGVVNGNLVSVNEGSMEIAVNFGEEYTYGRYVSVAGILKDYDIVKNRDNTYTLNAPNDSAVIFNSEGRPVRITDENGKEVTLAYNTGQTIITDVISGKRLKLNYNADGLITTLSDDNGRHAEITYENGCIKTITNENGEVTTYYYDEYEVEEAEEEAKASDIEEHINEEQDNEEQKKVIHKITSEINHDGIRYVSNKYDAKGRVISQQNGGKSDRWSCIAYESNGYGTKAVTTDEDGNSTTTFINSNERVTKVINEMGSETTYKYDDDGNLICKRDDNGSVMFMEYDSRGNLISQTDYMGNTTTIAYDDNGNPVRVTDEDGSYASFTYDDRHRLISSRDYAGQVITYTYTPEGLLASEHTEGLGSITYEYEGGRPVRITNRNGNATTMAYDGAGNMTGITDALGNTTSYTYDNRGNMLTETDAAGAVTSYEYDCNGAVISVTDAKGNTVRHEYNGRGFLIKEIYPDNTETKYEYNNSGRNTATIHQDGTRTEVAYNGAGNVLSETFPDGTVVYYEYDSLGQLIRETDAAGSSNTYEYYPNGRLYKETLSDGESILYTYDTCWRLVRETDHEGNSVSYEYDRMGNVTKIRDALGNEQTYEYDIHGRLIKETDPNGNETSYGYDNNNNCIRKTNALGIPAYIDYDACNRPVKIYMIKDGEEYAVEYTYDALGRVTAVKDEEGSITTTEYDELGNVVSVTDADGNVTAAYTYDNMNRTDTVTDVSGVTAQYCYDIMGNLISTISALNTASETSAQYTYDILNRVTEVKDALGGVSSVTYDNTGNIKSLTDPDGGTSEYEYDSVGRLIRETNAVGSRYTYTYNAAGLLKEQENARNQKTGYTYDAAGRLTSFTDEAGTVGYTYDKNGNILKVEDENGTIKRTYDSLDRVTSCTDYKGNTVKYSYDEIGNLISLTYPGGEIVRYSYYKNGLLKSVADFNGQITSYEYDKCGRLTKTERANGTVEECRYDRAGRLVEKTDYRKADDGYETPDKSDAAADATDRDDNAEKDVKADEKSDVKITEQEEQKDTLPAGIVIINHYTYTYDAVGNIIKITGTETVSAEQEEDENTDKNTEGDENADKNTESEVNKGAEAESDADGDGSSDGSSDGSINTTVTSGSGISKLISATMSYDEANRLTEYNGEKVEYDADGNMTYGPLNGEMTAFKYDCRNRLISAGRTTYSYNAENVRISAETDGYVEEYFTDSVSSQYSRVLEIKRYQKSGTNTNSNTNINSVTAAQDKTSENSEESTDKANRSTENNNIENSNIESNNKGNNSKQDSGQKYITETTRYVYGNGLISQINSSGYSYYHYNHLGSTTKLTDDKGYVTDAYTYGPYGELLSGNAESTIYLYNGRYGVMTDNNGLYYMRARYYNTDIKRFMNQDIITGSIGNSQSLNRYAYVQGNPISYTDPFGLSPMQAQFMQAEHFMLTMVGMIPFAGAGANVFNAYLYYKEGNKDMAVMFGIMAGISGISAAGFIAGTGLETAGYTRAALYVTTGSKFLGASAACYLSVGACVEIGESLYKDWKNGDFGFNSNTVNKLTMFGLSAFASFASAGQVVSTGAELGQMIAQDTKALAGRVKGALTSLGSRIRGSFEQGIGALGERLTYNNGLRYELAGADGGVFYVTDSNVGGNSDIVSYIEGGSDTTEYVDLTDFRRTHILNNHKYGAGKPDKTEFPQSWSDDKILHYVSDVATDPNATWGVGKWNSPYAIGIREGIEIRVDFYPDGHKNYSGMISTAYPLNTPPNPPKGGGY